MPDLFDYSAPQYPVAPGYKRQSTSQEAAAEIAPVAKTLRDKVLAALREREMTPDQCAVQMNKSILSIRPRFSELVANGCIVDTGKRRLNASGKSAIVWRAA